MLNLVYKWINYFKIKNINYIFIYKVMNKEHFSIEYVQSISNTLKMNKIKCYEIFLTEIKKLIINKAKQGENNLYYQIPAFKLGVPPYNKKDCAIFLHDQLKDMKFDVEIFKNNENYFLNIKWGGYTTTNTTNITINSLKKNDKNNQKPTDKYTYIHSNGIVDELPINNDYKKSNTIHI